MIGMTTILVVDDHVPLAENIAEFLENAGYQPLIAHSAEEALQAIEAEEVDALITDYWLPGLNGAELIRELRRRGRCIPALVISAFSDDDTIDAAKAAGATDVVDKPLTLSRLLGFAERMHCSS